MRKEERLPRVLHLRSPREEGTAQRRDHAGPARFAAFAILSGFLFASCRSTGDCGGDTHAAIAVAASIEEQVRFVSGVDTLAGTLFRPAQGRCLPAVVILAGSDRSARGALRIRIAEHFAKHGVAALVYDSPGTGSSTGNALLQTGRQRASEAYSVVAFLRKIPGINPAAVGLFGGSEGANVSLAAAASESSIAFVIPVSGSVGVPRSELLRYSAEKKGIEEGFSSGEILQLITFKEITFCLLGGMENFAWPSVEARTSQWDDPVWREFIDIVRRRGKRTTLEEKTAFRDSLKGIVDGFSRYRWFRTDDIGNAIRRLMNLDPSALFDLLESGRYSDDGDGGIVSHLAGVRCPVLSIWGQEDAYLPPDRCAAALRNHLGDAGHRDFEVILFPNATHFLTVPGSGGEFVPGYLDTIVTWIGRRFIEGYRDSPPEH